MSWDDSKVDGTDAITASIWNNMVTDQKLRGKQATTDKRGSDCSGSDGDTSRTLTLSNTELTDGNEMVYVGGNLLHSADYSMADNSTNSVITFNNKVWDNDYIRVLYFTSE